ncbi:MAG: single-stranded-DNA-specific exonuclease RecJ [Peptococcaceae bacterium]|nr:single-stranded-DNA-specific exonuclease RecJ [Peptococcaceae bacterium]
MRKIWTVRSREPGAPLLPFILKARGHVSPAEAVAYLSPSLLDLHDPFLFRDMRAAVGRLLLARRQGEKILVHGDYDADGVTATALLYLALTRWGFSVIVHIPERSAGYGLQADVVRQAAEKDTGLIITVDCGVKAVEEAALAKSLGVDLIVTDHHEPGETLPEVAALLNPKTDGGYPCADLAGVGVAFKLVQAVAHELGVAAETRRFLDIAALGTIADVVPLTGENRIIVTHGLRQMARTVHAGLRALLKECGIADKTPQAGQIAFMAAPRINAAGRMDTCRLALNLLLTEDVAEAEAFARELTQENLSRQKTEQDILEEAHAQLAEGELPRAIVLASPHWKHGVIGIVASRLVERYHRPSYLISVEGDKAKGSARGIEGYHVLEALTQQQEWLTAFGGHVHAAGFSLKPDNIDHLRSGLNENLADAPSDLFVPRVRVDAMTSLSEADMALVRDLARLAPYGAGNPSPVFGFRRVRVLSTQRMGKEGQHLKLRVTEGEQAHKTTTQEVVAFNRGEEEEAICTAGLIDLVAALEINHYRDLESVQILLRDWAPTQEARWIESPGETVAQETEPAAVAAETTAEATGALEATKEKTSLDREHIAAVYKALQQRANEHAAHAAHKQANREQANKPAGVPIIWENAASMEFECVKILEELGLVYWLGGANPWTLFLVSNPKKRDLTASFRYTILSDG